MNNCTQTSGKKVYIISFSPTGTSYNVAKMIAGEFHAETTVIDLCETLPETIEIEQGSVCIFSVPSYGGRVPKTAVERLTKIRGEHTPAVLCVTYGNRAIEDTLLELSDAAKNQGFQVAAACSVIAEHNIMHVYGAGRPDDSDKEEIAVFAQNVVKKLKEGNSDRPSLPGNRPYKEWRGMTTPILVDEKTCISCGLCASKCPVQAISPKGRKTDEETCISCMRCVKICPQNSRRVEDTYLAALIERLKPVCENRKENTFYL